VCIFGETCGESVPDDVKPASELRSLPPLLLREEKKKECNTTTAFEGEDQEGDGVQIAG